MIKVAVSEADLLARIDALEPKRRAAAKRWRARAAALTAACLAKGHVAEGDGIWSEIKSVFIEVQRFKCIYCERLIAQARAADATSPAGRVVLLEHDVEHFRPKNRVRPWPPDDLQQRRQIQYAGQLRHGAPAGYVGLAFDPLNYAIACKVCNTSYKLDYFPIFGTPTDAAPSRAARDAAERPALLLPLGTDAEDPATLLTFLGAIPVPAQPAGPAALRAKVLLDFFELDTRDDLIFARANLLMLLWPQLERLATGDAARRARAAVFIDAVVRDGSDFPHVACARAFVALYAADRAAAERHYDACEAFLVSKDPAVFGGA